MVSIRCVQKPGNAKWKSALIVRLGISSQNNATKSSICFNQLNYLTTKNGYKNDRIHSS